MTERDSDRLIEGVSENDDDKVNEKMRKSERKEKRVMKGIQIDINRD